VAAVVPLRSGHLGGAFFGDPWALIAVAVRSMVCVSDALLQVRLRGGTCSRPPELALVPLLWLTRGILLGFVRRTPVSRREGVHSS